MDAIYLLILAVVYGATHALVWALRAARDDIMTVVYYLAGVLALFLFGYLLYALLRAEQF